VAHLDENTYPRGNPNSLMTPAIAPGENIATAGPIVLAVFKDLGWSVPLGTVLHDATGDRNNDFVARNPDGSLFTYPGNGHGAIMPPFGVSTIFGQFLKLALSADWNGDNVPDIIGKRPDGTWWLLRGTGAGKYSAPVKMGTGGTMFNTWFAPGDFNGDGKSDLIGRKSDGTLVMLKGNGAAGFGAPQEVGTGFDQYNLLFSPGDFNGDQKPDVLARTTAGKLMFLAGDGTGHLAPGVQVTSPVDWNTLTMLFSPGDFNGDGKSDLIGRKSDGTLWMYRGNGAGGLIGNNQIGSGFNSFNLMR